MLSMKGLSLKIDTDYNNCLLSGNIKLGTEDLKKIGKNFYFCPYSGVRLKLIFLIFLYLPTIVFYPLLFAIS